MCVCVCVCVCVVWVCVCVCVVGYVCGCVGVVVVCERDRMDMVFISTKFLSSGLSPNLYQFSMKNITQSSEIIFYTNCYISGGGKGWVKNVIYIRSYINSFSSNM